MPRLPYEAKLIKDMGIKISYKFQLHFETYSISKMLESNADYTAFHNMR